MNLLEAATSKKPFRKKTHTSVRYFSKEIEGHRHFFVRLANGFEAQAYFYGEDFDYQDWELIEDMSLRDRVTSALDALKQAFDEAITLSEPSIVPKDSCV